MIAAAGWVVNHSGSEFRTYCLPGLGARGKKLRVYLLEQLDPFPVSSGV